MSARQGTEGAQSSRRSARLKKTVTLEPIPETGTISGSPTPTWSREISPAHPPGGSARPEKELFEEGEDEFMPTTQEVAETLARMKSGAVAIDRDRGDEASSTKTQAVIKEGPILKRVSPLFAIPVGAKKVTETYLSEDMTWPTFMSICSEEMKLKEGSMPEFSWKFSNGPGSKVWTTLSESSYPRMMKAAAKKIRARAKREGDLKDADLGFGWRIDLMLENQVEVVSEEEDGGDNNEVTTKEREKKVKKGKGKKGTKDKSKGKKRKHHGRTKPRKKARNTVPAESGPSGTSDSDSDSESDSTDSEVATVARLQNENTCSHCRAPCMLLTDASHHCFSVEELSLWATMIPSDQKHGNWNDYKHPPKVVIERVYESNLQVQLPASLTGRAVASSRNQKSQNFNPSYIYPHGPFPGWMPPYPVPSAPAPYPPYTLPGPSNAPSYMPYHTDHSFNSPTEGDCRSPGDSDEDLQYPTTAEFFAELMETESSRHYFTNYTDAFHDKGFYRIDQLADENLDVNHMMEIVEDLKEGTARVIKTKALAKVKKIRKTRGKKEKKDE